MLACGITVGMFVDELTISVSAGDGGDGVVRWRQEKFKPRGGPSGGNGGRGGDVYMRAVPDSNRLSKYTGVVSFTAERGEDGRGLSQHGANADDLYIDIPVGSVVTDVAREREYVFLTVGQTERILRGGSGGLGNEHFKSSTNRTPLQSTEGRAGESGDFRIEVSLVVDVGLVGLPNAGKSSLLNALTNSNARVGDYPFTTVAPHLGDLYGITIADIPGLIEGAAEGKGLGHRFLRHITRTKMLLHIVSLDSEDPKKDYYTICNELSNFGHQLDTKQEWIILSKKDVVEQSYIDEVKAGFDKISNHVLVLSILDDDLVKNLRDTLVAYVRDTAANETIE